MARSREIGAVRSGKRDTSIPGVEASAGNLFACHFPRRPAKKEKGFCAEAFLRALAGHSPSGRAFCLYYFGSKKQEYV